MTDRSFTFLVNPASGGGAAPGAVVGVARLLRDRDARVDVTYSPGLAQMPELVTEALDRGDVVVSVGGDGMLSSVVGLVAEAGGTLGIVPAGRGNDFARMLAIGEDPTALADLLMDAPAQAVDLIRWFQPGSPTRWVAGSVYAGVDARAAELVDQARFIPRNVQYPYAAMRALATYRPANYRVEVDGVSREFSASNVVVANSGYYGKGMHIAPEASVTDGQLDVVVIEASSRLALMKALPTVYKGEHIRRAEVTVMRGTRVELHADADLPVAVGGDGEPLGALPRYTAEPAVAEVVPGVLNVLMPTLDR